MPEFLVHMEFNFPQSWASDRDAGGHVMQDHYTAEANRAAELASAGLFKRVWRVPGRRGHISLWECANVDILHQCLESWPMFDYMDITVTALAINHNDPGGVAEGLPGIKFTYTHLRRLLDKHGAHGETHGYELGEGISIHDHPGTDRGLQIHVMCQGQKIAEIGPPTDHPGLIGPAAQDDSQEATIPGYIDLLAEWAGRPVIHARWQQRILSDNGLLHSSYTDALAHSSFARHTIRGQ